MNYKERTWEIVEAARSGDTMSRIFDVSIILLIFANVFAVIASSVASIQAEYGLLLYGFEVLSVGIFSLEYLARIWSCTADGRYSGHLWGRLRFALRPIVIVDLLAILPFFLPFLGVDLRSLRAFRLVRVLRIVKVGRYYSSLNLIKGVLRAKKEELLLTSALMAMLLLIASTILFYCENTAQPDKFSSIPATMWWAVATLTTVGYGDMYPITQLGKLFASGIAILGIGMFALPTGILGAGFVEEIQRSKKKRMRCPHCGGDI